MMRNSPIREYQLLNFQTFLAVLMLACASGAFEHMSIPVGIVVEHNFYNQFGLKAAFSDDRILKGRPRAALSYTTSRLQTMFGSNALKKDNFLFTAGWHFRPLRLIDPYISIDAGFTRFNREDDIIFAKLKNTGGLLALRLGIESDIFKGLVRPWADAGFSFISSSTVFPLVFSLGLDFDIAKGIIK
jgi:hypothetical protein